MPVSSPVRPLNRELAGGLLFSDASALALETTKEDFVILFVCHGLALSQCMV